MFKKLITYLLIIIFHAGLLSSPAVAYYSYNSSEGINVGISGLPMSKARVGPSFGYSQGSGNSDSAWVNNQTTIIGTNSVNISADTAHIKGAVIANIMEVMLQLRQTK
jgi:hypothetical protein